MNESHIMNFLIRIPIAISVDNQRNLVFVHAKKRKYVTLVANIQSKNIIKEYQNLENRCIIHENIEYFRCSW
jgi:hypothetical protein